MGTFNGDGDGTSFSTAVLRAAGVRMDLAWGKRWAELTREAAVVRRRGLIRSGMLVLIAAVLWLAPWDFVSKVIFSLVLVAVGVYSYQDTRRGLEPLRRAAARRKESLGGEPTAVLQFTFGGALRNRVLLAIRSASDPAESLGYNDWFWWLVPEEERTASLTRFSWGNVAVVFLAEKFFATTAGFSVRSTRGVVEEAAAALGDKPVLLPNAAFGWVQREELRLARS